MKLFISTLLFFAMPLSFAYASGSANIQSLVPGPTVNANSAITFQVIPAGFIDPVFQAKDSFPGSSLTSNSMNRYSGYFAWTPVGADIGSHTITVSITDSSGDSATVTQQVTVNASGTASVSVQNLVPGTTLAAGQTLTLFILPSQFKTTIPTYSVSDTFSGSTLSSGNIASNGRLSWTPAASDAGTHLLSLRAQDTFGDSAIVQQQIIVTTASGQIVSTPTPVPVVTAPTPTPVINTDLRIQSLSSNSGVVGSPITFTAASGDLANPVVYTVSDTFGGSTVANANITNSGSFKWSPVASDVGVHELTVIGTDSDARVETADVPLTISATGATAPAASAGAALVGLMDVGTQTSEVSALQDILTQQGFYTGPVNGSYGPLTQAAVKKFQTAHGIAAQGNVGPATLAALNALNAPAPSASTGPATFSTLLNVGSTGAEVTALQNKLTAFGDYSGPINGNFGPLTQAAVEKFQTANTISPVGYTGPATRTALNAS